MEMLPNIKRVSKRTLLCLYFSCATFLLCAFYTFFTESDSVLPENSIQNGYAESSIMPSVEENIAPKQQLKDRSYIGPDEIVAPAVAWTSPSFKTGQVGGPTSLHTSTKSVAVAHADTKYIYLPTFPIHVSTSTKATSSVPASAPILSTNTCQTFSMKDAKLILLWTPFFGSWNYFETHKLSECHRCRNCRVTNDRTKIRESDAVVFHARDMSLSDLPPVRYPHQRWIFYCLESPPYSDFPGLMHMVNMFNWTMTYRSDSDIVTQYGSIVKLRPPRKLDLQSLHKSFENKSKSVVWMSSHCPTHGGRDDYVEELRKYIDVDVYGTCGSLECPPNSTRKCLHEFSLKYKFFLAFENTVCKDYVTEKLYRTLEYNMIPVVFGGASYTKFAPPSSFIDAMSFKSPKHLAFFLAGVGNDFKMYSTYFKWRESYAVRTFNNKECELCSLLHQTQLKSKSYKDLKKWWVEEANCRTWKPKR